MEGCITVKFSFLMSLLCGEKITIRTLTVYGGGERFGGWGAENHQEAALWVPSGFQSKQKQEVREVNFFLNPLMYSCVDLVIKAGREFKTKT